jgi:hypothetical protein
MKALAQLVAIVSLLAVNIARANNPVIVHEWGTFTSLQDENGKAIGGINVDDEPVPSFVYDMEYVHNLAGTAGARVYYFGLPPYPPIKGWRPADQDVTMRLETPVIYFYPPKNAPATTKLPLTVHVDFHGGLLSQYYPYAETNGFPGAFPRQLLNFHLADCVSGLTWTVTHFGSAQEPPETPDNVWTTPREVSAPEIEVKGKTWNPNGGQEDTAEAEHFLFYRGVGHLDSPLTIDTTIQSTAGTAEGVKNDSSVLRVSPQGGAGVLARFSESWLVQIRENGICAFVQRDLAGGKVVKSPSGDIYQLPGWFSMEPGIRFKEDQFASKNITKLQALMQAALVKAGLYPDEASAMLRTWELSYFKSPGLRFFYIVPRAWVDKTLPLTITGAPVEVTRVMVGRIELISDEQKKALARLKQEGPPNLMALKQAAYEAMQSGRYSKQEQAEFDSGTRPLSDLGITLSPSVRDYLSLGRFRDALIVHEQAEHPSDNLARFIHDNGLAAR